ncbi:hypothetical protein JTB14_030944 [Gonioctena quinquepunctata]|nr:hypothetical protein JTB14_030944 [Gonioctena quinquepunctata]
MNQAVDAVVSGEMGYVIASYRFELHLRASATYIPSGNPAERIIQEVPTAPATALPAIETLEDLSTPAVNALPDTEISEDAVPSAETPVDLSAIYRNTSSSPDTCN